MAKRNRQSVSLRQIVEGMMKTDMDGTAPPAHHIKLIQAQTIFAHAVFEAILAQLKDGQNVRVKNFGTFSVRMAPETARNPKTRECVKVNDRKRLFCKASDATVKLLNTEKD